MGRLVKAKLALVDGDHYIATDKVDDGTHQWSRKILSVTGFQRSVSIDRSFERGTVTLTIDDTDGLYKAMMTNNTNRKIDGKTVTFYAYQQDGVTIAETLITTIQSFKLGENIFTLVCVQEFAGKMTSMPASEDLRITIADWPNAYSKSIGKRVPMPFGVLHGDRGASHAFRVNSTSGSGLVDTDIDFVATWSDPGGPAKIISCDDVFNAGWKLTSIWSFSRNAGGWELIHFAKLRKPIPWLITCNLTCTSPVSATGNPVPSLRAILALAGATLLDDGEGGTSDFEDFCTTNSWSIYGKIPDNVENVKEYLELWCHNFDCFWRIDAAGVVHIKHIDWTAVTVNATLSERHFIQLSEDEDNTGFANRINVKFNYDSNESDWKDGLIVNSIDGDVLPSVTPIQINDEYVFFAYTIGGSHPVTNKIKYIDHPVYTIKADMDLYQYEIFGLNLLSVVDITHSNQISGNGKYLIMRETRDYINCSVAIEARRLWGA
jgi:Tfp pilus assembly protein PilZ